MIASSIMLLLTILGETCSHRPNPAFVNRVFSLHKRPFDNNEALPAARDGDDALLEAEEAAALDAHDVSDPGMEGAAMERSVILATEMTEGRTRTRRGRDPKRKRSFVRRIRSLFRHEDAIEEEGDDGADLFEGGDAEARYARDLSDVAALEHADEVSEDSVDEAEEEGDILDANEAEAKYAHDLSDVAAMEHADEVAMYSGGEGEDEEDLLDATEAEANYAHDLSDVAAMEHADEVARDSGDEGEDEEDLLDATEAEARYAHDLSDVAAMEHADQVSADNEVEVEDEGDLSDANESEANYARDPAEVAAAEHADEEATAEGHENVKTSGPLPKKGDEARIASIEAHYRSVEKDISMIERLIEEASEFDLSEGHSLERTFSDEDAADLALMMVEKSVLAATDKLELCQEKAARTEYEVKAALEEKYAAKALAESIERERRAAEMRFLSTEHYDDDADVAERRRDSAVMHADDGLLADAHKREHEAEMRLETAIEEDIATRRELEQMIDNKLTLKQELHDLEEIIHERTVSLWEKENAEKTEKETKKRHHFDWWHKRW